MVYLPFVTMNRGLHVSFEKPAATLCVVHLGWIPANVPRIVFAPDEP
jgi:hypothetical protein